MKLDKIKKQVIIGSLLGDAYIHKDKRYNGYEFIERHSIKQTKYLKWKNRHLNFKYKEYKKLGVCLIRKSNKIFKEYKELFYKENKKRITKKILEKLSSMGLAIWYMDDGDYEYRSSYIRLATHTFKLDGNKIIKEWFESKWRILSKIRRRYDKRWKREYFYIEFNKVNGEKLIRILKDHIIRSMEYKIGLDEERRKKAIYRRKEYSKMWWKNNEDKRKAYYKKWKISKNLTPYREKQQI